MPVIVATQGIVAIVAVVALILSLTRINDQVSSIQQSRYRAALTSCELFRHVILIAGASHPGRQARTIAFLNGVGLTNCSAYARRVTRP